jgi:DNA topoisomerase-1
MSKTLVIVESPTKAKTLNRFLGDSVTVLASMGHIRDLPQSSLGVEVANRFTPKYILTPNGKKVFASLKKEAAKAETIYLAPDPDREGEAIAWHLQELLKDHTKAVFHRVTFHEITKTAIDEAFAHPGEIDMPRVDAQQARRVLDRLVGYQVSPTLWKNIQRGTSAGRVQSVALRLICEREKAVVGFEPVEYWTMDATFRPESTPATFSAKLLKLDGKKPVIGNAEFANALAAELEPADFIISAVNKKPKQRRAAPPFITSTLQQAAGTAMSMSTNMTMRIAQELYEGIEVGPEGAVGLITYMRTDSVAIAKEAQEQARDFIASTYGPDYLPAKPNVYKSKQSAQGAHEAIRPTDISRTPEKMAPYLSPQQRNLYRLIWNRFAASQMAPAKLLEHSMDIEAKGDSLTHGFLFRAVATATVFPGFLKVYDVKEADQEEVAESKSLPELAANTPCSLVELEKKQCFTQPPPRFSEATLVKELEANGVGRPSTYASIIHTILQRTYVQKEKGRLHPTELGNKVNEYLTANLDALFQVTFTAHMESELDAVENGKENWTEMLSNFYDDFQKWIGDTTLLNVPQKEQIKQLLDVFHDQVQWAEPTKRGRRTYDDQKFCVSLQEQLEEGKAISDRQWQALLKMTARYADQLPKLTEVAAELGISTEMEQMIQEAKAAEKELAEQKLHGPDPVDAALLAAMESVSKWEEPVKRGKRVYDDKKFYTSLKEQVEQGKKLSDPQQNALKRILSKYSEQISNYDALVSEYQLQVADALSDEDLQNLQEIVKLADYITEWQEPKKRGKRVYDDHEFATSISSQLSSKKNLSDRQIAAFKKLLSKYVEQIPDYEQKAAKLGLPAPPPKPEDIKQKCPECGGAITARQARGRQFFGCANYPKCKFTAQTLEAIPSGTAEE